MQPEKFTIWELTAVQQKDHKKWNIMGNTTYTNTSNDIIEMY